MALIIKYYEFVVSVLKGYLDIGYSWYRYIFPPGQEVEVYITIYFGIGILLAVLIYIITSSDNIMANEDISIFIFFCIFAWLPLAALIFLFTGLLIYVIGIGWPAIAALILHNYFNNKNS